MRDPEIIIYHGGCWDGYASYMIARTAINNAGLGQNVEPVGIASYHGMEIPENIEGKHVLIADFSFNPQQMLQIAEKAESTIWCDHHKTAVEAMEPHMAQFEQHGGTAILDMERSGAGITWDFFHPEAERIPLVNYIEDGDLWRKSLPNFDAVNMWIRSHEQTVEDWYQMCNTEVDEALASGLAMHQYHETLTSNAASQGFWAKIGEVEMPITTCSYDIGSSTAGTLIEMTGSPVAGYVLLNAHGKYQYGLRSVGDYDCSAIAVVFGGGGHLNASGFKSETPVHEYLRPL